MTSHQRTVGAIFSVDLSSPREFVERLKNVVNNSLSDQPYAYLPSINDRYISFRSVKVSRVKTINSRTNINLDTLFSFPNRGKHLRTIVYTE